jgi:hypothetical protein
MSILILLLKATAKESIPPNIYNVTKLKNQTPTLAIKKI